MSIQDEFGFQLKALRLKQGYSVPEFAKKAGVSRQHIRELESCQSQKRVTITTIEKIAKALEVPVWELLKFESKKSCK